MLLVINFMNSALHFLNLNIEGSKHLHRVERLIREHAPQLIALQEVHAKDVPLLSSILGHEAHYESMATQYDTETNSYEPKGVLTLWDKTFADVSIAAHRYEVYTDAHEMIPQKKGPNERDRVLLVVEFTHDGKRYRSANTHFIWTPDGSVDDLQRRVFASMLKTLEQYDDETGIILSGDFNAPRGREIFGALAKKYQDNIPKHITTTLDQTLHRVKGLQYVVDGLFTTPQYQVASVDIIDGVSDHMAIRAHIR